VTVQLSTWLVAELDETVERLTRQVIEIVPPEARRERLPGANSIGWATFHVARHARLALRVSGIDVSHSDALLADADPAVIAPSSGLHEVEQPVLAFLATAQIDEYALAVFGEVRSYLSGLGAGPLDPVSDIAEALRQTGLDEGEFGWLYGLWSQRNGFLVRWPLIGHITHHVGEMITLRNQMGLSPFR
jgi:hypothetical protein